MEVGMTRRRKGLGIALCLAMLTGCSDGGPATTPADTDAAEAPSASTAAVTLPPSAAVTTEPAAFAVVLDAFEEGGAIPDRYTCLGANDSPELAWSGVPAEARALTLMVYDADAGAALGAGNPLGFLHWMVYDLPPAAGGLPASATRDPDLLAGGIETANDFASSAGGTFPGGAQIRGTGYDGPCPPAQHTYVFRLLALSEPLGLPEGTPYAQVLDALEDRVLAVADWTGRYPALP
jgi:hypothetical protein